MTQNLEFLEFFKGLLGIFWNFARLQPEINLLPSFGKMVKIAEGIKKCYDF